MAVLEDVDIAQGIPPRLEFEHLIWSKGYANIAGIDEAGCGPLAGPVVAAAVVFPAYSYISDIRDSKKLSARQREAFFPQIIESALSFGIGIVHHQEIDRINIRQATFKAMKMALGGLKLKPGYLLIDGYELPGSIYQQEAVVDGDDHCFTIAAASVLAKVTRDRLMVDYHEQYPQYGFDRHKGYGTKLHREMIKKYGPCPIHRQTFIRKIMERS